MPNQKRGPWTCEEDKLLLKLIDQHGAFNWVKISALLKSRSPKQCRERYHQNLKPSLNKTPISEQEGELIQELVAKIGKKWAEISRVLNNGRSDNAIKNWWNGGTNKRKRARKSIAARQIIQNYHMHSLQSYVQTREQAVYVPVVATPPPQGKFAEQQALPPLTALTPNVSRRNSLDVAPQNVGFKDAKRQFMLYSPEDSSQSSRCAVSEGPAASFVPRLPALAHRAVPLSVAATPASPQGCHNMMAGAGSGLAEHQLAIHSPPGSRETLYDTHDRNALCKLDFLLNKDEENKAAHVEFTSAPAASGADQK
ncbi:AaceriAEL176Cp [[Ashbya] aceris (nom. inval.)]|nr:AaceriAEL176Cp [[Ashbya] aceris (nom. inval.)]